MRTILLFDVLPGTVLPAHLLGINGGALLDPTRVQGIIEQPASLLARLDASDTAVDLVVISTYESPMQSDDLRKWGFGWRCGRDLNSQWLGIALLEGRIRHANWMSITSTSVDSHTYGDSPHSTAIQLSSLLAEPSTEIWLCRRKDKSIVRLRDVRPPSCDSKIKVWHGSPISNLSTLNTEAGRLWVSFSDAFATCFGATPHSNRGYFQGVDCASQATPSIYMVIPAGEEHVLEQPCSLYQAEVSSRELCFTGVSGYEIFVHRSLDVLSERHFLSCREALEAQGVEVICLKNAPLLDEQRAAVCRPYRHALEGFLGMPLEVALRMPCKQWAIQFWLIARGLRKMAISELVWLQGIIERCWLPSIAAETELPEFGYHSVNHLMQTSLTAAWIALQEDGNPVVAAFAGLLHDCGRQGDEDGTGHAGQGVAIMESLFGKELRYLLNPDDFRRVKDAIAQHASAYPSNDKSIGSCWDADRVRLAWEYGVDTSYFSTPSGLLLANIGRELANRDLLSTFGERYFL